MNEEFEERITKEEFIKEHYDELEIMEKLDGRIDLLSDEDLDKAMKEGYSEALDKYLDEGDVLIYDFSFRDFNEDAIYKINEKIDEILKNKTSLS